MVLISPIQPSTAFNYLLVSVRTAMHIASTLYKEFLQSQRVR